MMGSDAASATADTTHEAVTMSAAVEEALSALSAPVALLFANNMFSPQEAGGAETKFIHTEFCTLTLYPNIGSFQL